MSQGELDRDELDIEIPEGITYLMSYTLGTGKDGRTVYGHNFQYVYGGDRMPFIVASSEGDSDEHIEDMVGEGAATMMARIMLKKERMTAEGGKIPLGDLHKQENTWHRRDFAALLRDYKASAARRRTFTSGSIYYSGITVAKDLPEAGKGASGKDSASS